MPLPCSWDRPANSYWIQTFPTPTSVRNLQCVQREKNCIGSLFSGFARPPPENMYYQELQQRGAEFEIPAAAPDNGSLRKRHRRKRLCCRHWRQCPIRTAERKCCPQRRRWRSWGGLRKYSLRIAGRLTEGICILLPREAADDNPRRDVFIAPSIRYADPRIGLAQRRCMGGIAFYCVPVAGHALSADDSIAALISNCQAYRAVASNLPNNAAAGLKRRDGRTLWSDGAR